MRPLIPATLLLLAGCATTRPAVDVQIQEVRIPVAVPCVAAEDIPEEPPLVGDALTGNARADSAILASSALLLRAALREALALMQACVNEEADDDAQ